jgi:hypothetical protein
MVYFMQDFGLNAWRQNSRGRGKLTLGGVGVGREDSIWKGRGGGKQIKLYTLTKKIPLILWTYGGA